MSSDWKQFVRVGRALDRKDVLAGFRQHFCIKHRHIYLDGNSLGLASIEANEGIDNVWSWWRDIAIGGWTGADPPWFTLAETLGSQMAALVGAEADEVVCTNSTTVNLHQLLATIYHPTAERRAILTDSLNFPSDGYAVRSHLRLRGVHARRFLRIVESRDGNTIEEDDVVAAMDEDVQVAVLPVVEYRSGQMLDVERVAAEAGRRRVTLLLDCSHSIGIVPHALDAWGVDGAFWCGYKYLNGGPGSSAGLYLNRRHFGKTPGLAGWFGSSKDAQFDMRPDLELAEGAGALQIGTPNILSMAPLIGTLPMLLDAGIDRIRAKSLAMTGLMMGLADEELSPFGFNVVNPREERRRGGHIALAHPEAARICKALRAKGVVPDFRPPDIVRLAPSPLYTRYEDCVEAIRILAEVMESREFERFDVGREIVS